MTYTVTRAESVMNGFKPTPYPKTQLRQVVWRFRDVEELPAGFNRDGAVRSPEDVYRQYRFLFDGLTRERFVVFILNSKNAVQAVEIVTEGILNSSLVHPRETFRSAILGLGVSIIVAHNHPSGNPEPSAEDLQITKQLVDAGKIVGIPVHDHIIFTERGYSSLAERGLV
jgi:DNA repair protein RadC